jgi:hypothetical protein
MRADPDKYLLPVRLSAAIEESGGSRPDYIIRLLYLAVRPERIREEVSRRLALGNNIFYLIVVSLS